MEFRTRRRELLRRALALLGPGLLVVPEVSRSAPLAGTGEEPTFGTREWTIDGVVREALVAVPSAAKTNLAPVVFAFHGHGGSMFQASRSFGYHRIWPEAIVVYPQGLNTPGQLTDPTGHRPGWQRQPGDQGDRDLKLFDAILATLRKERKVDEHRVYATGHSNGGGFTYLLWATRSDVFAAVAPSAAVAFRGTANLKPKPVLHVAGEKDTLVKFSWQQAMIERLRRINRCEAGKPWAEGCTLYPSRVGAPVVTYIHSGDHVFPAAAPGLIARFFREHARG